MRIGTFNADYARRGHIATLADQCRKCPTDLWVITETHDGLCPGDGLTARSTPERGVFTPGPVRVGSRWVSIWSRYPHGDPDVVKLKSSEMSLAIRFNGMRPLVVLGVVLPWQSNAALIEGVNDLRQDLHTIRSTFPGEAIVLAGDFNTDMGNAPEFGLQSYFGAREGTRALIQALDEADLVCPTVQKFPLGLKPRYPPIDHIAISKSIADDAAIQYVWSGRHGHGERPADRIGIVVNVPRLSRGSS